MHPYLSEVFPRLDASRAALKEAIAAIPEPLRRQRPEPDGWSAVEILEHLSLVENRFCAAIGGKVEEAIRAGLGPETGARPPLPAVTAGMLGDRSMRRSAPEPVQPAGQLDEAAAWAAAEQARANFRAAILRGDGLALSTIIHVHLFFGALNVYQWVELIAGHEMRHAAQIREMAARLAPQGS